MNRQGGIVAAGINNRVARRIFALLVSCCLGAGVQAEELLKSTTTWEGKAIAYPEGTPEITSIILKIGVGDSPPFHCHPVPTFGYVLKGTIEVETREGRKTVFTEGQSVVEVMRTVHRGRAVDGPVEIVVFYAGASGVPVTVLPEDDAEHAYCDA